MNLTAVVDIIAAQPFIWQSSLWLAAGITASRKFSTNPSRAHAILFVALAGAVVSPLLTVLAGHFGLGVLPRPTVTLTGDLTPLSPTLREGWISEVVIVLLVTSAVMLGLRGIRLVRSLLHARRLLHTCVPVADETTRAALATAIHRCAPGIDVTLLTRDDIRSPSIWCWSRPAVILVPPLLSARFDAECLASIFSHELAHLSRRDHVLSAVADLLVAAVAWNPLAWIARTRLRRSAERACDAVAGDSETARADYADALLELATDAQPAPGLGVVSRRGDLGARIRAIFENDESQPPITRRFLGLVGVTAILLLTLLAPLQPAPGIEYWFGASDSASLTQVSEGGVFVLDSTDNETSPQATELLPDASEPSRWIAKDSPRKGQFDE